MRIRGSWTPCSPLQETATPEAPATSGFTSVLLGWTKTVVRVYVWASAIVDGKIVATDYAPDVGWIEMPPQADE